MAELIKPTDTLAQGYPKINVAIEQAEQAFTTADNAMDTANSSIAVSNQALANSQSTQEQLNQIVIDGDSSVEAAQARVNADNTITYDTLKERLDAEHQEVSSQLADLANKRTHFKHMGVAFDTSKENSHVSWLHCNVSYDVTTDEFFVVYNTQHVHGPEALTVTSMRKKPKYGDFSAPIVIVDRQSENLSCKTQSSGICANGDYITITNHALNNVSQGTYVYRSVDKGLTWDSGTPLMVNGSILKAYGGDVSGFRRLSSGRIILWYWDDLWYSHALYSDDNGLSWSEAPVGTGATRYVTEPTFVELSDGTIVGYGRYNVSDGTDGKKEAWFIKSTTGGSSWEAPFKSTSILDMTNNNCSFIKRRDSDIIEIVYGSRFKQADGLGSIYQAITTEENIKNDVWLTPIRIGKGNAIPTPDNGDFGYFGAAVDTDDTALVFFYNGNKTKSAVNWLVGNTHTAIAENENTDYKTGFNNFEFYPDQVNAKKGLTSGDFDRDIKGFLRTLRKTTLSENLYMELAVGGGGDGVLSLNKVNADNTITQLTRIQFYNNNIVLPDVKGRVASGNFDSTNDADKGSFLARRYVSSKKITFELTVDSAGNPLLIATDVTGASVNIPIALGSDLVPVTDKVQSLGATNKRFNNGYFTGVVSCKADTTANRPTTGLQGGAMMFDTTLGKPIWYDWAKAAWVDANGTVV